MQDRTNALIELNVATLLLGLTPLFAKLITLSSPQIILGRSFFGLIGLGIFVFFTKQNFRMKNAKDYFKVLFFGILMGLHWLTLFESVKVSSVAVAMIALFTFPVITTLLEPYFFKEKLKSSDFFVALIVLFGVTLIVPVFDLSNNVTQGVIWGVISAIFYALRNILMKRELPNYSGSVLMFYQIFASLILFLPYLFFSDWEFVGNDLLYLVIVGILFTSVAHSLFTNSLAKFKAKTASVITSLQLVYSTIAAALIIGEIPDLRTMIGGLIILGCVIFETYHHV